ncbi:MAG: immunoglobulin domain-containing protein [Phycisphaerales bacterium]|nr:immunoglobulin domain-containing protein [Phycisphaerales bacterium]
MRTRVLGVVVVGGALAGVAGALGAAGGTGGGGGADPCVPPQVPPGERDFAACLLTTATLTVQATGTGLHYQWRRYSRFGTGLAAIPNSDSPTLTIPNAFLSDAGRYDCIVFNLCGSATTPIYRLGILAADRAGPGGVEGTDGSLSNDDFIVFINQFFEMDQRADVGGPGGFSLPDGQFDNNDFIAYINLFFAYPSCP